MNKIVTVSTALIIGALQANANETFRPELEHVSVIAERTDGTTPSFEEQKERFLRRPGAETVVSTSQFESSHLGTLENVFANTPGVYSVSRGSSASGLYSIRGSDIATDGPRNGRGIRAYMDGVPLGRTEAGLTVSLIDILATDYVELYRGANSLRFGSIASGGAMNFISRTGRTYSGSRLVTESGAFGYSQLQFDNAGLHDDVDYYYSLSDVRSDGYREHTDQKSSRLSSNLGWMVNEKLDTRFYLSLGRDDQESASAIPLNEIEQRGRETDARSVDFDTDRNFAYFRLANRSDIALDNDVKLAVDSFVLYTDFDHLPTPFSGFVDNIWREGGLGLRADTFTHLWGLDTEMTGGVRASYTEGEFRRFRHLSAGQVQGDKVNETDFTSLLIEAYGELAIALTDQTRVFFGLQAVDITRELVDKFREDLPAQGPFGPPLANGVERPQPGSTTNDQGYEVDYNTVNPKLGLNWEFKPNLFLFTSLARSYEVPTGSDVSDVVAAGENESTIKPQTAWTFEAGARGGSERFFMDFTAFYMPIDNEILTRCVVTVPNCAETIAFNAQSTLHQGVELGVNAVVALGVFTKADSVSISGTWNYSDFTFDNDALFGDRQLPVIPRNTVYLSVDYKHSSGFYVKADIRYADERGATYDGSGGDGWTIPSYQLYGMQLGWKPVNQPYSFYLQGANLTDEAYASTYTAEPTVPINRAAIAEEFVDVRVGDGRAWYAGVTYRF